MRFTLNLALKNVFRQKKRSFTLGMPIDQAKVRASYQDGVLEITLPKAEEAKPQQIKVEVHTGRAAAK